MWENTIPLQYTVSCVPYRMYAPKFIDHLSSFKNMELYVVHVSTIQGLATNSSHSVMVHRGKPWEMPLGYLLYLAPPPSENLGNHRKIVNKFIVHKH